MTQTPEQPTSGEILRAIGRVEKTIDGLAGQVHRLDDKLDGHGETLVGHGERIVVVEREVRDLKAARAAEQQHTRSASVGMRIAVTGAVVSSLGSGVFVLIQLLTHH